MNGDKKGGDNVCPLHDASVTALKTDMIWVKKTLHDQNTHLWGITLGILLTLIKVVVFS